MRSHPEFNEAVSLLGITTEDVMSVFDMMDSDKSGEVSYEEFCENLAKLNQEESFMILLHIKSFMDTFEKSIKENVEVAIEKHKHWMQRSFQNIEGVNKVEEMEGAIIKEVHQVHDGVDNMPTALPAARATAQPAARAPALPAESATATSDELSLQMLLLQSMREDTAKFLKRLEEQTLQQQRHLEDLARIADIFGERRAAASRQPASPRGPMASCMSFKRPPAELLPPQMLLPPSLAGGRPSSTPDSATRTGPPNSWCSRQERLPSHPNLCTSQSIRSPGPDTL